MAKLNTVQKVVDFFRPLMKKYCIFSDLYGLFECHGIPGNKDGFLVDTKPEACGFMGDLIYLLVLGAEYDEHAMDFCCDVAHTGFEKGWTDLKELQGHLLKDSTWGIDDKVIHDKYIGNIKDCYLGA